MTPGEADEEAVAPSLIECVVEAGVLVAIVVTPLFFNRLSSRVFEEEKVPLLRTIALFVLAALTVSRSARRLSWRKPLVGPVLMLGLAQVVAALFSILPWISLSGGYGRSQGLFTWAAYLILFLSIVSVVRSREQVERIVAALLLGSIPVCAYALIQHFGFDWIAWGIDVTERALSTAGNPIFLGAYLIMVTPFTAQRLALSWIRRRFAAGAVYALLLATQILVLLFTQSRGPVLAFLVAGFVWILLMAILFWTRRVAVFTLAMGGLIGTVLLAVNGAPFSSTHTDEGYGRLTNVLDAKEGSARIRTLIWEASSEMLRAAPPARIAFGHGEDTMFYAFMPFYPPEIAHHEQRTVSADRAHNEILDALITTGVLGCVIEMFIFLTLFSAPLEWMGIVRDFRPVRIFLAASALAGAGLAFWWDGQFRFMPLSASLAVILALIVVAALHSLKGSRREKPETATLLRIALLTAAIAHFVEIQFGIVTVVTRLNWFALLALAAVLGSNRGGETEPPATPEPRLRGPEIGPLLGLILCVIVFSFYTRSIAERGVPPSLLLFVLAVLTAGLALFAAENAGQPARRIGLAAFGVAAVAVGTGLLFAALHHSLIGFEMAEMGRDLSAVLESARRMVRTTTLIYAAVIGGLFITAAAISRPSGRRPTKWLVARGFGWASLSLAAGAISVWLNLNVARADVYHQLGHAYEDRKLWQAAQILYRRAVELQPRQDRYEHAVGNAAMSRAVIAENENEREKLYAEAEVAMRRAYAINPLDPDHPRNLARLYRAWARLGNPARRDERTRTADSYYERTTERNGNNAALWNEWALLRIEEGKPEEALRLYDHSLAIDDRYTTTWWLRANLRFDRGDFEGAIEDYDRALREDAKLVPAWSGKALALVQLGRDEDAIAANQEILLIQPDDPVAHRNLALLYRRKKDFRRSLEEAEAALKVAKSTEIEPLRKFIEETQAEYRATFPQPQP